MFFVEDTKMFEFTKLIDFGSMCVNSLDCSIYINLFSSYKHGGSNNIHKSNRDGSSGDSSSSDSSRSNSSSRDSATIATIGMIATTITTTL